jgi:NADH-quinone oxidoreductase subunit G
VSENEMPTAKVTIDGMTVEAKPGDLLIKVAQDNGVYIPRFCWHERMKPVGMCRMCLVEVDGIRGLPPACTMQVTDGMVCHTETPAVKQAQDDVLELLLVNHPLDCPVCDRGGECPLQDTTLSFGPGESRFVEEKRHFEKPIAISETVMLDRERCIQCARCTRFADEIAGDPLISFVDRGDRTQVLNHPNHPFASYFSGNVVQICPVGALTAKPYRFKARPWDLETVETSCTQCAVQCRGALQSTSNRLVRLLAIDSEPVNQGWLCDRGRFGFEYVHDEARVLAPRVGGNDVSWPEALDAAAEVLRKARDLHGPGSIAVLGGARGTNEDAYAWARLAKDVLGTDNVDCQLGDGLPAEVVLGLPRATIADCDRAAAIVLLGPDLKEELPVLHLRVRRAARELGVPIVDLSPEFTHGLTSEVRFALAPRPGEQYDVAQQLAAALGAGTATGTTPDAVRAAANAIKERDGDIVVILGRTNLAERPEYTMRAAAALAALPNVRFLTALHRSNVHGALDAGLTPGMLPGRVTLTDRDDVMQVWGQVPSERGLDAEGVLRAAADGSVHVLVLVGCDPIGDFVDRDLATRALANVGSVIAVDGFVNESNRRAEVFLSATLWGEKAGTVSNIEGRVQTLNQKVSPEGASMDDWRIATELAFRLGADFDLESVGEVTDELARVAPAFAGVTSALLNGARDGVVLPLQEHADEIMWRRPGTRLTDQPSWEPIKVQGDVAPAEPQAEVDGDTEPDDAEIAASQSTAAAVAEETRDLFVWDCDVAELHTPGRDQYALRLVSGRPLYDDGATVQHTASLHTLKRTAELIVAAPDMQRLGVTNGTVVKVTSAHASLEVPVRAVRGVAPGTALLAMAGAGTASTLVDASAPVTDVRVETIR